MKNTHREVLLLVKLQAETVSMGIETAVGHLCRFGFPIFNYEAVRNIRLRYCKVV